MRISRTLVAVAAAASVVLTGCSSETDGTAVSDATTTESSGNGDGSIDLASIDAGEYNTEPHDFVAEGQLAEDFGPAVEGQRLAEFVVHHHDIDPSLVVNAPNNGVVVGGLGPFLQEGSQEAIEGHDVITGFRSVRNTADDTRELGITVWRFETVEDAAAAAQALQQNNLKPMAETFGGGQAQVITLDAVPATYASTMSWSHGSETVETFTPHGMHVIYTFAGDDNADTTWLRETTTNAIEQQVALLDRFPATPTADIASLPVDLDKVLARTVGFLEREYARNSDTAIYGPEGWLHFDSHPVETEKLFEETGTDRVAKANSNVYRSASAEDAETLRDTFAEMTVENYPDLVEDEALTQGLPNTTCWSGDVAQGRSAVCLMTYGPYTAELSGFRPISGDDPDQDTLRTVPQRLGAQYTKFVRAEELGLGEN